MFFRTSVYGFKNPTPRNPSASDPLLSSTATNLNTGTTAHGHLNGFVTGRQKKAKQYAQSVALSLLKLIPNEQQDGDQRSATKQRKSTHQSKQANISAFEQEDSADGSYQHTIFNPGAVKISAFYQINILSAR